MSGHAALIIFAAALFVLGVALLVIAIRSEINLRRKHIPIQKDQTEKRPEQTESMPNVLPPSRPIVVPIRYGKITSGPEAGHSGISLRNDGEPAYNVSAHNVTLSGICTFEIIGTPEQLRKGDPDLSFGCWRNSERGGTLGSALYDFMVQHDIDEIEIPVTYRDADFNWYQTDVLLIKDQMARSTSGSESGIRVDWKQKKIAPPEKSSESIVSGPVPDVALIWELTGEVMRNSGLLGTDKELDKEIIIHNRSSQYIYNVQVEPVRLSQELTFDLINEIAPNKTHVTRGRWAGKSNLTTRYAEFFIIPANVQKAFENKWMFDKVHKEGMSDHYLKIPMTIRFECTSKYMAEFDFIFDVGGTSHFLKRSARQVL